ncbi:MAG: hypothetical protein GF400_09700 [Candidatus Eisenbacteria bacterium]|nr:hypothetical protein [Candidatus Eisenbacteria bacterium]
MMLTLKKFCDKVNVSAAMVERREISLGRFIEYVKSQAEDLAHSQQDSNVHSVVGDGIEDHRALMRDEHDFSKRDAREMERIEDDGGPGAEAPEGGFDGFD